MQEITSPAIAAAQSELIRQTQNAMMKHQDSAMWAVCEGVLEHADVETAKVAMQYGDLPAAQVLTAYINYLEELLQHKTVH